MYFISWKYLGFVALVAAAYYLIPKTRRWAVLLAASVWFYFLCSKWRIGAIVATILITYATGLALGKVDEAFAARKAELDKAARKALKAQLKRKKQLLCAAGVVLNLALLFAFKYLDFFIGGANNLLALLGGRPFSLLALAAPVGISYYTLMAISYMVDVERGLVQADKNLPRLALFLLFFPQIVEGPICRYGQTADALYRGNDFNGEKLIRAAQLMLWGFVEKMVIADNVGILADQVFNNAAGYTGLAVVVGIAFYTLQIYTDFMGCIDIVRGTAGLLGVELPQNFQAPFFARSVNEFWQRWHITLGTWLRDYIFYPISLSAFFKRLSEGARKHFGEHLARLIPAAFALFFVWFGNGMWHGVGVKYICYGLYYYIIMMLGQLFAPLSARALAALHINPESRAWRAFQVVRTVLLVGIGMTIFRAESLSVAAGMVRGVFVLPALEGGFKGCALTFLESFGRTKKQFVLRVLFALVWSGLLLVVDFAHEKKQHLRDWIARGGYPRQLAFYLGCVFAILLFGSYGAQYNASNFIYFQF